MIRLVPMKPSHALVGGLLIAFGAGGFYIGKKQGIIEGRVETKIEQAFNEKYGLNGLISDSAASHLIEMSQAFRTGKIPGNYYYSSYGELEALAEEGSKLRKELYQEGGN